jgi:hypothetical protein
LTTRPSAAPAARHPAERATAKSPPPPQSADTNWASPTLLASPEDLVIEPGEVGPMAARNGPTHPADVFRCAACERPECQVRDGGNLDLNLDLRPRPWLC